MTTNLVKNPGFEADWADDSSHLCSVFPASGTPSFQNIGSISLLSIETSYIGE